jgi:hypothetical protein
MFHARPNRSFLGASLLGACLALGLTLGACTKDTGESRSQDTTQTPPATGNTGEAKGGDVQQVMGQVLSHYDAIRALLVEDKGAEVAAHAGRLQAAAQQAGGAVPAAGKPHLDALGQHGP